MLTAVVYTGNTGFTEKYANWVANQLKCDLFRLEDVSIDDLKQYPLVVYGGWVKGGIIQGLDELRGKVRGKYIVFAVGALPKRGGDAVGFRKKNGLEDVPTFYFEGGLRWYRLTEGQKAALLMYKETLQMFDYHKLSSNEKFFLNNIGRTFDHSSLDGVKELTDFLESERGQKLELLHKLLRHISERHRYIDHDLTDKFIRLQRTLRIDLPAKFFNVLLIERKSCRHRMPAEFFQQMCYTDQTVEHFVSFDRSSRSLDSFLTSCQNKYRMVVLLSHPSRNNTCKGFMYLREKKYKYFIFPNIITLH